MDAAGPAGPRKTVKPSSASPTGRHRAGLEGSGARRGWRRRRGLARAWALATGAPPFGRAAALASWSTEARERRAARRQARLRLDEEPGPTVGAMSTVDQVAPPG